MMTPDKIKQMIEAGLPGCEASVLGDDGTHFQAVVICDAFRDKSTLQQHQLVYKTLGDHMGTDIHALSIRTYTFDSWQQVKKSTDVSA